MKFSFGVYDFLGYTLPGLMIIVILAILITPTLPTKLIDQLNGPKDQLPQYLNPNITLGIFYVFACYVIGLAAHGFINWMFRVFSIKWCSFKRYAVDSGSFEKGLFCQKYRDYPEDFYPYSEQFVHKLRHQIRKIFGIKVLTIQCEAERAEADVKYTEIFHLCRTALMKHSQDLYPRASVLLSLYNSAKLLGAIFCLATISFFLRIVIPEQIFQSIWMAMATPILIVVFPFLCIIIGKFLCWIKNLWVGKRNKQIDTCEKVNKNTPTKEKTYLGLFYGIIVALLGLAGLCVEFKIDNSADYPNLIIGGVLTRVFIGNTPAFNNLFVCYWVSASLCPIFFYLYHLFFRYYRNSILYGFYEYAINLERSKEKSQNEV